MGSYLVSIYVTYISADRFDTFEIRTIINAKNKNDAFNMGLMKLSSGLTDYFGGDMKLLFEASNTDLKAGVRQVRDREKTDDVEIYRNQTGNLGIRDTIQVTPDEIKPTNALRNIVSKLGVKDIVKGEDIEEIRARETKLKNIKVLTDKLISDFSVKAKNREKSTIRAYTRDGSFKKLLLTISKREGAVLSSNTLAKELQSEGIKADIKTPSLARRIREINTNLEKTGLIDYSLGRNKPRLTEKGHNYISAL